MNDINREGIDEVVRSIKDAGGEALGLVADVSEAAQVNPMVDAVMDQHGRIDVLVNNAGLTGADAAFLRSR